MHLVETSIKMVWKLNRGYCIIYLSELIFARTVIELIVFLYNEVIVQFGKRKIVLVSKFFLPRFYRTVKMHKLDQLFDEMLLARNKKLYTIYTATIKQLEIGHKGDVITVTMATMTIQDGRYFGF